MEYLGGGTLDQIVACGPLNEVQVTLAAKFRKTISHKCMCRYVSAFPQASDVFQQIAEGLQYVHSRPGRCRCSH